MPNYIKKKCQTVTQFGFKKKEFPHDLKELIKKINDLGDDFDNMSSGGKRCYNEIQKQLHILIPKLADAITLYEDA